MREIFAGTGVQLEFARDSVEPPPFESGAQAVDFMMANFGPLIMLRGMLEATGEWAGLREKLEQLYDRHEPGEFLVVQGRKS